MTGILGRTKTTALLILRWAVDLFMAESAYCNKVDSMFLSHAARYSERGSDSGQDADGYLNHHFPGFLFHHLLFFRHGLHGLHGFFDLRNLKKLIAPASV